MHRPEQSPPGGDHQSHDRLLVVRLASDDLSREERPAAEALRAACADCAALVRDIRLISRATARLPLPRRPRDFRLSPAQAQEARGSLMRRLMERLSAPSLGILQPLGAAAVAIGLVLVVVGMGLPGMSGASQAEEAQEVYSASQRSLAPALEPDVAAPAEGAPAGAASDTPRVPAEGAAATPEDRPAVKGRESQPAGADPDTSAAPGAAGAPTAVAGAALDPAATPAVAGGALDPVASPAGAEVTAGDAGERLTRTDRESGNATGAGMIIVGLLLGLTGLLVLILRVVAQRIGRDSALR